MSSGGVIGTAARGVVFALAGVLLIDAAVTYDQAKADGLDQALLTLRNQPSGEFVRALAALGLIIFGVYSRARRGGIRYRQARRSLAGQLLATRPSPLCFRDRYHWTG